MEYISKFGAPKDMHQTFSTMIHVAPKLGVDELIVVRNNLVALLGNDFTYNADHNKFNLNPIVAENIDFKKPEDGEIILRLRQLAKERSILYEPSYENRMALNAYLERKGIVDPMDDNKKA